MEVAKRRKREAETTRMGSKGWRRVLLTGTIAFAEMVIRVEFGGWLEL